MNSYNAWAHRDRGSIVDKKCELCGRVLYVATKSADLLCGGCGDPEGECVCPWSKELEYA